MENVSSNPLTEQEAYGSMATQLAMGKCVLFCGAGLNCDTGGATWDQLVAHLATVLGYESPLLGGDALVVLDDMVRTYGRTRVHDLVLAKLKGATLDW